LGHGARIGDKASAAMKVALRKAIQVMFTPCQLQPEGMTASLHNRAWLKAVFGERRLSWRLLMARDKAVLLVIGLGT
jgi:hypothetical protein